MYGERQNAAPPLVIIFSLNLFLVGTLRRLFIRDIKPAFFRSRLINTDFNKVVYMSFSNSRILCIESYLESCELISQLLFIEKHNFDFTVTHSPNRALSLIGEQSFDLYIVKSRLPEMTGVELCRRIRKLGSKAPILFLTGKTRISECRVALAAGVSEYLILPVSLSKLTARVKQLLDKAPADLPLHSARPATGTSFASRL